jgi:hypothetical protein
MDFHGIVLNFLQTKKICAYPFYPRQCGVICVQLSVNNGMCSYGSAVIDHTAGASCIEPSSTENCTGSYFNILLIVKGNFARVQALATA